MKFHGQLRLVYLYVVKTCVLLVQVTGCTVVRHYAELNSEYTDSPLPWTDVERQDRL